MLDRPIAARRGEPTSADNLAALVASRAAGPRPAAANGGPLSTWKALVGGATQLRRFKQRSELFELSNRILKCLDAANRPYAETLRLGLCPKEWLVGDAAVGVNTLKSANAFLKALKSRNARRTRDAGRRARNSKPPSPPRRSPAAGTRAEFASGLLGSAILTRLAGQDQTYLRVVRRDRGDPGRRACREAVDEPLMSAEEAAPFLEGAVEAGAIAPPERDLLAAIMGGSSLAEALGANLFLRRRLKNDFDGDLAAYVEDLSARTARFVGRGRAPDRKHSATSCASLSRRRGHVEEIEMDRTFDPREAARFLQTLRVATQTALALDDLQRARGRARPLSTFTALAAKGAGEWRFPAAGMLSADGLVVAHLLHEGEEAKVLALQAQGVAGLTTYALRGARVRLGDASAGRRRFRPRRRSAHRARRRGA